MQVHLLSRSPSRRERLQPWLHKRLEAWRLTSTAPPSGPGSSSCSVAALPETLGAVPPPPRPAEPVAGNGDRRCRATPAPRRQRLLKSDVVVVASVLRPQWRQASVGT